MLNPRAKLSGDVFSEQVKLDSIRTGFGRGLVKAGEADNRIMGLTADLAESTQMHLFKERFPDRFVEVGVAEQNLAGVASGMAAMGKIPFIASYAMFSPGRNWEHIRTTICYNDRPVKIVGSHAGVTVGPDGGTHQALEDIALMRVIPNMIVLSPCDALEAEKAVVAAAKTKTPVYLRLARDKTPQITTPETPFEIGKAEVFFQPIAGKPDVGIIATGPIIHRALQVAEELEKEKIGVTVINLSTIKPLDEKIILRLAEDAGALVTAEDHQVAGGMGSAVAEFVSEHCPVPIERVGVRDEFGQSGTPEELISHYGLSSRHIKEAVKKVLKRKSLNK